MRTPALCACRNHVFVSATKGYVVLASPRDKDVLCKPWTAQEVRRPNQPVRGVYVVRSDKGLPRLLHRRLVPGAEVVDHKNGNGLDNRRTNLRASNPALNAFNKRGHYDASNAKGAYFSKVTGRFFSAIQIKGKRRHLGSFATADQASRAYRKAEKEVFGVYARG